MGAGAKKARRAARLAATPETDSILDHGVEHAGGKCIVCRKRTDLLWPMIAPRIALNQLASISGHAYQAMTKHLDRGLAE